MNATFTPISDEDAAYISRRVSMTPTRAPENRRGTRTHREYLHFLAAPNAMAGGMTALLATRRQLKKAHRLFESGQKPNQVSGRIVRACLRSIWEQYGRHADSKIYM